jgi:hypothetical protein
MGLEGMPLRYLFASVVVFIALALGIYILTISSDATIPITSQIGDAIGNLLGK